MKEIWQEAYGMQEELTKRRRDLHRHPESAWTEFRTASMVAKELMGLGYEVHLGKEVMNEKEMMGVPSEATLQNCMDRAISEGADPVLVEKMRGGKTGVMGVMHFANPGKVIGLRFDMDSNEVVESSDHTHRPMAENFRSTHEGCMHACGHDGHVTVGLAVAKLIAEHKDEMSGTVKFFFQPAEEGVRGARAMVASGIVDDVEYFLSGHIGFNADHGFDLTAKHPLLVGGGLGLAPLLYLAKSFLQSDVEVLMGGRTASELFWQDLFNGSKITLYMTTDDGSLGTKGTVNALLPQLLKTGKYDCIYVCGPVPMMKAVVKVVEAAGIPCQISLEKYMACGFGACLSCACGGIGKRLKVCTDGPVFWSTEVEEW